MRNQNLVRNIILAFVFFFIGRVIVYQMGNTGIWIVFGLVAASYFGWWIFKRSDRKS